MFIRLIKYINSGNRFIMAVVDREYVGSVDAIYPVEFFQKTKSDGTTGYFFVPCNLSPSDKKVEPYATNIKDILILYQLGEDFIEPEVKRMYKEYLKLQGFDRNDYSESFNML